MKPRKTRRLHDAHDRHGGSFNEAAAVKPRKTELLLEDTFRLDAAFNEAAAVKPRKTWFCYGAVIP